MGESFRRNAPKEMQCSMFCGGRRCKYEQGSSWKKEDMAIDGIYSHWITDDILAMARPNTAAMKKHSLVTKFKVYNFSLENSHNVEIYYRYGTKILLFFTLFNAERQNKVDYKSSNTRGACKLWSKSSASQWIYLWSKWIYVARYILLQLCMEGLWGSVFNVRSFRYGKGKDSIIQY